MAIPSYKVHAREFLATHQRKTYFVTGITLITLIVFTIFAIRPTVNIIAQLNQEIQQREEVNTLLQEKINTLQTLQTQYTGSEKARAAFDRAFPYDDETALLAVNLEAIATQYEFVLESMQFSRGTKTEMDVFLPLNLDMTMIGKEENLSSLLKHVENYPRLVYIDSISYEEVQEEDTIGSTDLRFVLQGKVFIRPLDNVMPSS